MFAKLDNQIFNHGSTCTTQIDSEFILHVQVYVYDKMSMCLYTFDCIEKYIYIHVYINKYQRGYNILAVVFFYSTHNTLQEYMIYNGISVIKHDCRKIPLFLS